MLDPKQLSNSESDIPKIRKEKDSIILLNDRYNTPNTSLLLFHFEPATPQTPPPPPRIVNLNRV